MIGAFGRNLADSVFMAPPPPSSQDVPAPILMEFFPTGTFVRDQEWAVRSVGLRYLAWWDAQYVSSLYQLPWHAPLTSIDIFLCFA